MKIPAADPSLGVEFVVLVDEVVQRRQCRDEVFLADLEAIARLAIVADLDEPVHSRLAGARSAEHSPAIPALLEGGT